MKHYRLSELLQPNQGKAEIDPLKYYKQIKLRLYQKGVELREIKQGGELASKQFIAKKEQFIISKIDARNGAMGLVPGELDGAVVTSDFLLYDFKDETVDAKYFDYYTRLSSFDSNCKLCSEGSTNRVRLKVQKFLELSIPLPPLPEQKRIVAKIESIKQRIEQIKQLRAEQKKEIRNLLYSKYTELIQNAEWLLMRQVAPIIRREVSISESEVYPELGLRSFGKGTFHKPALLGIDVGTKKLYQIQAGDLMFSNVFAWEGAIAVAKTEDNNRYGSHRFISCVADSEKAITEFLCFHFLSEKGLEDINAASPGGAGRNKTLGIDKLMRIAVPLPDLDAQKEFVALLNKVQHIKQQHIQQEKELEELFPALLDKAFKGEL